MKDSDIMKDFDEDEHGNRFCYKQNCDVCTGINESGKRNGFGCFSRDEYIRERYSFILKKRKRLILLGGN